MGLAKETIWLAFGKVMWIGEMNIKVGHEDTLSIQASNTEFYGLDEPFKTIESCSRGDLIHDDIMKSWGRSALP